MLLNGLSVIPTKILYLKKYFHQIIYIRIIAYITGLTLIVTPIKYLKMKKTKFASGPNQLKTKAILVCCLIGLVFITGCSPSKKELFKQTDALVESLQTTYQSYGLLGGTDHSTTTKDGLYTITPIGRLINVKIQKEVGNDVYEELQKDLEKHYKNDARVNKVYVCGAGTIMIDCRN